MGFGRPTRSCAGRALTLRSRSPIAGYSPSTDDYRAAHGVEPICRVLLIAAGPTTPKRCDLARLSARAGWDAALEIEVRRVFRQNSGRSPAGNATGHIDAPPAPSLRPQVDSAH